MLPCLRSRGISALIVLAALIGLSSSAVAAGRKPPKHRPQTCSVGQFTVDYFNNTTLSGTSALSRCESAIDNSWGSGGPGSGITVDNFSARWDGQFGFSAGDYTFTVTSDDGLRMWVDGTILIDAWKNQPPTTYTGKRTLTDGNHSVKVEYYEASGAATAQLGWEKAAAPAPAPTPTSSPTTAPAPTPTPTPTTAPAPTSCTGVQVLPTDSIQAKIDASPAGSTICLSSGVYRLSAALRLKDDMSLVGPADRSAVLSGARRVSAVREGSYWVLTGQASLGTSSFPGTSTQCATISLGDPQGMCIHRDQLFLNDVSLWQENVLSEVGPGDFFWDYGSGKIYFADDPTGRNLEISANGGAAISTSGARVKVRGVTVEKFGNPVMSAALSIGTDWTVENVRVRLNHGIGACTWGNGSVVRNSRIDYNGEMGACGQGDNVLWENNEIDHNNIAAYKWWWEGGGTKWVNAWFLTVRNNFVHHNYGLGLWTDWQNYKVVYEGNRVENNEGGGIEHEISYDAIIRNNVVKGNGFGHPSRSGGWGAGIEIATSPNVEIYGNVVEGNANAIIAYQSPRGTGDRGIHEVRNLYVHDNTVKMSGGWNGLFIYNQAYDDSVFTSKGNRFVANNYSLSNLSGTYFKWKGQGLTKEGWRGFGNDTTGSFGQL
ncbi:MAG: PA14 domain-containing protein [Actinomycetota bacterium]